MPDVQLIPMFTRPVGPIPGVPEAQAQALNRRLRLGQQLRSYRMTSRPTTPGTSSPVTAAGEPIPA